MDISDYPTLLKRLREGLPQEILEYSRFKTPKVDSFIEGNRTFIRNFREICDTLSRPEISVLKYVARELATAGSVEGSTAVFQGKFTRDVLDSLIERYTQLYVICPICKRPDTKLSKEGKFLFLICEACGAKSSVIPT